MKPQIQTSWDDGGEFDQNISALLLEYNLPGIFFWPYMKLDSFEIGDILTYFDIGSHTLSHVELTRPISSQLLASEIIDSRKLLEVRFNKNIDWFCPPRGRYNEKVLDLAYAAGYKYFRTTVIRSKPEDKLWHGMRIVDTDLHIYQRKEYNGLPWLEFGQRQWDRAVAEGWPTFHIWGHGWEIERDSNWDGLIKFFDYITQ